MTRRDFELIAETVKGLTLEGSEPNEERRHVAESFAARLDDTNPRFDRARFLKACGVEA